MKVFLRILEAIGIVLGLLIICAVLNFLYDLLVATSFIAAIILNCILLIIFVVAIYYMIKNDKEI